VRFVAARARGDGRLHCHLYNWWQQCSQTPNPIQQINMSSILSVPVATHWGERHRLFELLNTERAGCSGCPRTQQQQIRGAQCQPQSRVMWWPGDGQLWLWGQPDWHGCILFEYGDKSQKQGSNNITVLKHRDNQWTQSKSAEWKLPWWCCAWVWWMYNRWD